jgi:hypothetical protein
MNGVWGNTVARMGCRGALQAVEKTERSHRETVKRSKVG